MGCPVGRVCCAFLVRIRAGLGEDTGIDEVT